MTMGRGRAILDLHARALGEKVQYNTYQEPCVDSWNYVTVITNTFLPSDPSAIIHRPRTNPFHHIRLQYGQAYTAGPLDYSLVDF